MVVCMTTIFYYNKFWVVLTFINKDEVIYLSCKNDYILKEDFVTYNRKYLHEFNIIKNVLKQI